jgi:hypothetical protein
MGINLVIITAIALLVLIIIAIVISDSGGNLREGLGSCSVNGGVCLEAGEAQAQGRTPLLNDERQQYPCNEAGHACYSLS